MRKVQSRGSYLSGLLGDRGSTLVSLRSGASMLRNVIRELLQSGLASTARFKDDLTRCLRTLGVKPLGITYGLAERAHRDRVLLLQS